MSTKDKTPPADGNETQAQARTCGLIMPISGLDGLSAEHWTEVRTILTDAVVSIPEPTFKVRIVSDADEAGIIQKRIVQNVYISDIIVCDVSGKNPNVMFELGMRLAFDKPVVIVKDDKTDYSFDTGIIEHLTYPRDLRFGRILEFKEALATKVLATYSATKSPDHSPFLKNFGRFHVASLSETEVSPEKLTLEMLEELRREIIRLGRKVEAQPQISKEERAFAGKARLRRYIRNYVLQNNPKTSFNILNDPEFARGVISACEPLEYFDNVAEYRQALDDVIDSFELPEH